MHTLQELRESKGLSKAKLARRFGVTDRTIYAWEKHASLQSTQRYLAVPDVHRLRGVIETGPMGDAA